MRSTFNKELARITDNICLLGEQVNQASARAVTALVNHDFAEAREVKRSDKSTDQLRYEIENDCLICMATQQPVAYDLRLLVATTFVAVELERCGDYAKGVAKAARRLSRANTNVGAYNLAAMQFYARGMVERAVNAFISGDVEAARIIITDDDHVDSMYNELVNMVTLDMADDFTHIESGTWLIHAGHCIERIADRATNIAERVLFVQSGDFIGDMNVHPVEATRKVNAPESSRGM